MTDGLSSSDVALLSKNDDMWNGGGAFFWVFALLILAGGGNFGGWGGNNGGYATSAELQAGLANQSVQNQLNTLAVETANNNYETANLISAQTNQMLQQNSTNLINAIQGFNTVNQNMTAQNAGLAQQIADLSYHLDRCCCEIKTQMLQDKLDSTQAALVAAQGSISNANQSQYLLSQLGRFVAWDSSGSQTSTTGA